MNNMIKLNTSRDFSISGTDLNGNIIYTGCILFEAGDYPDKKIKIDQSDLKARVLNTSLPIDLDLEHIPFNDPSMATSVLKGMLGSINNIYIDQSNPNVVRGDVTISKLFNDKLKIKGVSMVVPFPEGRGFTGATITYNPRISSAALMSASDDDMDSDDAKSALADMLRTITQTLSPDIVAHSITIEDAVADRAATLIINRLNTFYSANKTEEKEKQKDDNMSIIDNLKAIFNDVAGKDPTISEKEAEFKKQLEELSIKHEADQKARETKFSEELEALRAKMETDNSAKFAEDNIKVIDALVSEFKILPTQRNKAISLRAKDVVAFDQFAATLVPDKTVATPTVEVSPAKEHGDDLTLQVKNRQALLNNMPQIRII